VVEGNPMKNYFIYVASTFPRKTNNQIVESDSGKKNKQGRVWRGGFGRV
jgi:hypothetical protein